jgi:site-specific recombinase XerD
MSTVVGFDPLRDKRYQQTRLGRDVVDFLAWLELGGAASRTLDQYERDLSRGCLMFPGKDLAILEDGDALHIAKWYKPGERRVRVAAWRSFYKWGLRSRRCDRNPFDAATPPTGGSSSMRAKAGKTAPCLRHRQWPRSSGSS